MARKSKAATAADDVQIEDVLVTTPLESELYVHPEFKTETFEDISEPQEEEEQKTYLKTFPYGIHIEYVNAGTLRYCDKAETVTMTVKFSHLDFEVPFTASADDIYEHGRWLLEQAQAGAFGDITPYERPLPTSHDLQMELDKLMVDITLGLATEDELALARNLRKQIKVMEG
ncbi:tail fiber assembly chaperone [Pseudomonas phage COT4]|uniref:Tail fiber assembly chaperone n=1 Tax=Pseudomonas phage M5.1 TaxID=2873460 RepID=A0AAE9BP99_9CAUD|nr:tail fiber assembly chaperone [Pseudomonas phage M5.1]UAV89682.1 tail fiber assembly chaperone [Pseudomonas phage M5.1]UGL61282.1 tail fiber assembly chaperone [Pseudomonas phage COT4]